MPIVSRSQSLAEPDASLSSALARLGLNPNVDHSTAFDVMRKSRIKFQQEVMGSAAHGHSEGREGGGWGSIHSEGIACQAGLVIYSLRYRLRTFLLTDGLPPFPDDPSGSDTKPGLSSSQSKLQRMNSRPRPGASLPRANSKSARNPPAESLPTNLPKHSLKRVKSYQIAYTSHYEKIAEEAQKRLSDILGEENAIEVIANQGKFSRSWRERKAHDLHLMAKAAHVFRTYANTPLGGISIVQVLPPIVPVRSLRVELCLLWRCFCDGISQRGWLGGLGNPRAAYLSPLRLICFCLASYIVVSHQTALTLTTTASYPSASWPRVS